MVDQLLLAKRLFLEACRYADLKDAVSAGLAVSLLQDACEMMLVALMDKHGAKGKAKENFTGYLDALAAVNVVIPERTNLIKLNALRVNFKHHGGLPDPSEAEKYRTRVEDFLRRAVTDYFGLPFDDLSLVELVPFPEGQGPTQGGGGVHRQRRAREGGD